MSKGGARPNAGRPKGATDAPKRAVLRRLREIMANDAQDDLIVALTAVADDAGLDLAVRTRAVDMIGSLIHGRVRTEVLASQVRRA